MIDLLVLTRSDQLLFKLKLYIFLFYKKPILLRRSTVLRLETSLSVRIPWGAHTVRLAVRRYREYPHYFASLNCVNIYILISEVSVACLACYFNHIQNSSINASKSKPTAMNPY